MRDVAVPLTDAKAMAAAMRPLSPLVQLAIRIWDAGREITANLKLVAVPCGSFSTWAWLDFQIAAAGSVAAGTGCRALSPGAPFSPFPIDAPLSTWLGVAGFRFLFVLWLAGLTTITRSLNNVSRSALRTTTTFTGAV